LFYSLIKMMVRLALDIFCRKMVIKGRAPLSMKGPVLVVANHPNSFLDAIIIGSLFNRPVHFLARGDAFHKPWHAGMLRLLNMIPVYRLSEGKENLYLNEEAFRRSKEVLSQNGIVLIFIEGICVHKHELQPFKKGAGRIANESRSVECLHVLPIGIAYDSFEHFGKQINIQIGKPLFPASLLPYDDEAKSIRYFNERLFDEINQRIQVPTKSKTASTEQALLFLPGIAGYVLHLPIYTVLKKSIQRKTKGTVFYDSVLFGTLLFLYPLYLILVSLILLSAHLPIPYVAVIFMLHPVLAWCAVQWRSSFKGK
jgi:1-acyl-sn-glycerol-3-phosphate acyltransferase